MKKLSLLIAFLFSSFAALAQTEEVEMADFMRASGKIYVVVAVLSLIFVGLAIYLFSLDRKLTKLEKEQN